MYRFSEKWRATLCRCRSIPVGASVSDYPFAGSRATLILLLFASISVHSRLLSSATAEEPAPEKITFQDHVFPIFEDACLNCHNPDETKGGLDLSTYGAAMAGGSGGDIAAAGDPASSRVLLSILHREEPFMPPKKPMLEKAAIETLTKWIDGGLLDNPNSKPKKKSVPDFAMTLTGAPVGKPDGPPAMPERLLLEPEVVAPRPTAVRSIATSPWGPLAALTGQQQVLLYHTDNHGLLGVLPFPEGFPEVVTFSRNGSLVIAGGGLGGKSGKVIGWDVKTGKRVLEAGSEFDTVLAADISPDQSMIALGGPKRNIKVFDTKTGDEVHNLKKHPDWLLQLAYSPNGKFLASGGRSGGLYLWDAPKGIEFFTLKGHTKAITGLTWRDDSKILASCSEDDQVILWETKEGKQVKKWAYGGGGAQSIHFDHVGNVIVGGRDKKAKIYNQDGKLLHTIAGPEDIVLAAAFTHDGKRAILGDWTGAVTTWSAEDSKRIGALDSNPPTIVSRLEWLDKRKAEVDAKLAAAKKAHDDLVKKKADLEKKKADQIATITTLTEQRKAQDAQANAHKGAVANLAKEVAQLQASVATKQKAHAKAVADMQQAQQHLAALQTELNTWRQRLTAEQKAKTAFSTKPAWTVQVADSSPNGGQRFVVAATDAAKPPPAKPAPKAPQPQPAPKKKEEGAAKPVPAEPAAPKPKPEGPAPSGPPSAAPPKPQPPAKPASDPAPSPAVTQAKQKVDALADQVKTAEADMQAAQGAAAEAKKALDAETAKRATKEKELKDRQAQQAAAEKASKDLAARTGKLQEETKALETPIAEAGKAIPGAKANLDKLTAEAAALPKQIAHWKAAFFHVEVVNEQELLDEMQLNYPEQPTAAEKAALERQQMKVAALAQHHRALLEK